MNTQDLKHEIQQSLDKVPESVLQHVLAFLKEAERQPQESLVVATSLRDILAEDKALLERLAK